MDESPSIFHVISGLDAGGAEKHLLSLSRGLVNRGWDVSVGYLKGDGELEADFEESGCEVFSIDTSYSADPFGFARLIRNIRRKRYDLIHTHLFRGDVYGSVAGLVTGTPVISTKHNNAPYLTEYPFKLLHELTVSLTDEVVTISDFLQKFHREHTRSGEDKFTTIHYGINATPFTEIDEREVNRTRSEFVDENTVLVGVVARLIEAKGIDTLLTAFDSVVDDAVDSHLVVVGDGPEAAALRDQVHKLDIEDAVTFTGFRSDIPSLMNAFDLFVLPSRREGFGLVLLEAMAAGTPAIGTRVGAIPEVIEDGQTGVLVQPDQPANLSKAIKQLIFSSNERDRLGVQARKRVDKKFTVERMCDDFENVYRRTLN